MKKKMLLSMMLAAVMVLACAVTSFAADYSKNWYEDASGWHIKDASGNTVKNAWLCDDVQDASKSTWYLIDANGNMVSAPLVQDGTGNFYSLETAHNGYYGSLRHIDGTYDGIALKFEQTHGGSFGAVKGGLDALKAKFQVVSVANINNSNCVYTSSFGSGAAGGSVSAGGSAGGGSSAGASSGIDTSASVNAGTGEGFSTSEMLSKLVYYGEEYGIVVDSSRPAWKDGVTNIKMMHYPFAYWGDASKGGYIYRSFAYGVVCLAINSEGYLLADTHTPDGYYVNKYGAVEINGKELTHASDCQYVFAYKDGTKSNTVINDYDLSKVDGINGIHTIPQAYLMPWGTLIINHFCGYAGNSDKGFGDAGRPYSH